MDHIPVFCLLMRSTHAVIGSEEPVERYFASMFASFYEWQNSQPSCSNVKAIARGERFAPRKLLRYYQDAVHPRCPEKLREDLAALTDCCFAGMSRREALREALEGFWKALPQEDAADLQEIVCRDDLAQMWACLTWYALCADQHE